MNIKAIISSIVFYKIEKYEEKGSETSFENDGIKASTNFNIKRNIYRSFAAKILNILLGIVTLPLALSYLNQMQFGIYSTLTSIVLWVDLLDIGLGQGLRNKLTEAYARNNIALARTFISTAYVSMSMISGVLIILFLVVNPFLSWDAILNVKNQSGNELTILSYFVFISFSMRMVTALINKVYFALHKSSWIDITQVIGKVIQLIVILFLIKFTKPSLLYFGILQCSITFLVPLVASIVFFRVYNKEVSPSIKHIDFRYFRQLIVLGARFFVIQICLLFINSVNNLLISQFINPKEVTPYQITYSFFNYFTLFFSIVNTPFWSAYTAAWTQNKVAWIKISIKKVMRIYFLFVIAAITAVLCSPFIFHIWIGNRVYIPVGLSAIVCTAMLVNMWITIFDFFINGIGKIKLQMYLSIVAAVFNIPIAYILSVKLGLGTVGIVLATIFSFSLTAISSPTQTYLILNGKAKGIFFA